MSSPVPKDKHPPPVSYADIPLVDHFDGEKTVQVRAYSLLGPLVDQGPFDDGSIVDTAQLEADK